MSNSVHSRWHMPIARRHQGGCTARRPGTNRTWPFWFCRLCLCGGCVDPLPAPSLCAWRKRETALWHAHHDADGNPPPLSWKERSTTMVFSLPVRGVGAREGGWSKGWKCPVLRRASQTPVMCTHRRRVSTNVLVCGSGGSGWHQRCSRTGGSRSYCPGVCQRSK